MTGTDNPVQGVRPRLSLITTCKGRLAHLRRTLPLMVAQPGCEVVVVDYDCPQRTEQWVRSTFPQVRTVKVGDAAVFSASKARNRGAEVARGEWLAFVDADILLSPEFAARLGSLLQAGHYYRPRPASPDMHGTFVCSRSDFLELGGYDEAIRGWGGEDVDIYHRIGAFFGRKLIGFPSDWLDFIPHGDAERTQFAELSDKVLGQCINAFYRSTKYDLCRLIGASHPPAAVRERVYAMIHRAILEATDRAETTAKVELDVSGIAGVTLPPGSSLTRQLRYQFRMPAAAPEQTSSVDSAVAEPRPAAPSRTPMSGTRASAIDAGPLPDFRYLKRTPLSAGPTLFAMVRNESYLLPHFLGHYRRQGIENFVFYDDHSTDGTLDLLVGQDSCTVLTSPHAFREVMPDGRSFQLFAKRRIPEGLGTGRWILSVDADEFLILPQCFSGLQPMYAHLDALGHRCVLASMVDFYPERLADRGYSRTLSPFEGSRHFDVDRAFDRSFLSPRPRQRHKGVRARLLSMIEARDRAVFEQLVHGKNYRTPALWKVPLIKVGSGVALESVHDVNVQPPFDIELALAHFKFGPDLDERIAGALLSRSYFRGSIEYEFLRAAIDVLEGESLVCPGTMAYAGPQSLEQAGFVLVDRWGADPAARPDRA
ncbi:MAG: glycosyltransferase family 2 protein [Rubrivivax sp.]|nr:glycosyltransferase family 2 protein [Rubrivivax sp.]